MPTPFLRKILLGFILFLLVTNSSYGFKAIESSSELLVETSMQPDSIDVVNYCLNKTLSVSAHIVLDSMGQTNVTEAAINAAMVSLSQEFAPICLSFKVCKFDTVPDFNFDKFVKEYHQDEITKLTFVPNTINMYFVASVKIGSSVVGGYGGPGGPVLIKKSALSVIPHEVGHYLTLMHTFDMPGELADGSNGDNPAIGDGLRDTEADPNTAGVSISDCGYPGATLKDANGDFYLSPVDNIMSYYSGCQCPGKGFTPQQLNQVAKYLLGLPSDPW